MNLIFIRVERNYVLGGWNTKHSKWEMQKLYKILSQEHRVELSQTTDRYLLSSLVPYTILWPGVFAAAACFYDVGSEIK